MNTLIGWVVLPAAAFALVYYPLTRLIASGLVSPYAKADIRKRIYAAALDGLLLVSSVILYQRFDSMPFLILGAIYLAVRDMRGQSIGKLLFGLVVMDLETGKRATLRASLRRNVMLIVPGINIAAVALEFMAIVRDPQGQRLGDRLAQTQVVEGLGAKELIDEFQRWWQRVAGEMARGERRRRVPSSRVPELPSSRVRRI
ncbi:MAG TPA: RDD family protein [Vicinamibacterales bacterium]